MKMPHVIDVLMLNLSYTYEGEGWAVQLGCLFSKSKPLFDEVGD